MNQIKPHAYKPRLGPKGTLLCDVCDRPQKTLGGYGSKWSICLRCFNKADKNAAKEHRWPEDNDFVKLKATLHAKS